MIQAHKGPTAPIALVGVDTAELDCSGLNRMVLQADLLSSPNGRVYFRADYGEDKDDCSPANAEGYITDGGTAVINLDPWIKTETALPRIYLALTDAAGVAANGGANDRMLVYAEKGYTELAR